MQFSTAKDVALSLTILLNEEAPSRNIYRLAACELLGKGFRTWEPHINGAAVLRSLIKLHCSQPTVPGLFQISRQAIFYVATINPGLFCQTLMVDLVHSKSAQERIGLLRIISIMINKVLILIICIRKRSTN